MTGSEKNETGIDPSGPLAGVRVLALEQAVAGPLCTRHLADLGADVVKIERPGGGDFARRYDTAVKGLSSYFFWLNRGKRSLTLDMKHPEASPILERLVASSDVVVQNLGPGAIDRLGFAPERLRRDYPALVITSISGYGAGGPYESRKAFDLLLQGETGVIATTGNGEDLAKVGISVGDIGAAVYGTIGTLAALYERRATGEGRIVETSLFDALSEWMGYPAYYTLYGGEPPARAGVRHATVVPYGSYRCADGAVLLAVQTEAQWKAFCQIVCQHPEWETDERFTTSALRCVNRVALEAMIEESLLSVPREEVVRRLDAADVPFGSLNEVTEFVTHPQLAARNRWREVASPAGLLAAIVPPFDLEGMSPRMEAVPDVGDHTDEILTELGYEKEAITGLHDQGIV
ncbi:MAG TPA: CaiB/BaiF CoA-transferase family protein [Thermomicrobiales bacterium]|nr:CaiB/BaiF CoA-transferase family protein [Thermomicrobiales bacterium]